MAGTWSGTYQSEHFVGPGAYQAKDGVRGIIDMKTTPGPVTIAAPLSPEQNSSFIVVWDNPTREELMFTTPDVYEEPTGAVRTTVPSIETTFKRGLIAFTFVTGEWEITDWSPLGVSLNTSFAVEWTGQAINGLCVVGGSYKVIEIERTGLGLYTVRVDPGALDSQTIITPQANAVGLPAESNAIMNFADIGMAMTDEVLLEVGYRKFNGQFFLDDLIQDPANKMILLGQQFP